jgi:membrane protease YdiL (CAAX protease family)
VSPPYAPIRTPPYNQVVVDHDPAERASWVSIGVFLVIAYGFAWLACLPLWLGDGLTSPWMLLCGGVMMYTPTLGALVAAKFVERQPKVLLNLGIWPVASWRRILTSIVIAFGVVLAVVLTALVTSAIAGTYVFDLRTFHGAEQFFAAQLAAAGKAGTSLPMPIWVLVVVDLAALPLNSLIASGLALGEEIGWRGFLYPRLRAKIGDTLAVVTVGVIWGVWHAPLLLLGYNYPTLAPGWRLVWMSVFCIQLTAILAWVRQRSRSVWPAAIGHGTVNASLAMTALLLGASPDLRTAAASLMGWAGWPVGLLLAAWLLWRHALRPWHPAAAKEAEHVAP